MRQEEREEMRRARLLQAAAVIFSSDRNGVVGLGLRRGWAVQTALALEEMIDEELSKEGSTKKS